jgi:hypothetical protein
MRGTPQVRVSPRSPRPDGIDDPLLQALGVLDLALAPRSGMLDELAQLRHRLHVGTVGGLDRAEGGLPGGHGAMVRYGQGGVTFQIWRRYPQRRLQSECEQD